MPKIPNSNEYVPYPWPEYQEFMGEDWFRDECYYCADADVYFVPKERCRSYMKVYRIQPHDVYGGGCALVCAMSTEEAIKTFCSDEYKSYMYEVNNCTCNPVVGLDYETNVSHIIFNDIYIE